MPIPARAGRNGGKSAVRVRADSDCPPIVTVRASGGSESADSPSPLGLGLGPPVESLSGGSGAGRSTHLTGRCCGRMIGGPTRNLEAPRQASPGESKSPAATASPAAGKAAAGGGVLRGRPPRPSESAAAKAAAAAAAALLRTRPLPVPAGRAGTGETAPVLPAGGSVTPSESGRCRRPDTVTEGCSGGAKRCQTVTAVRVQGSRVIIGSRAARRRSRVAAAPGPRGAAAASLTQAGVTRDSDSPRDTGAARTRYSEMAAGRGSQSSSSQAYDSDDSESQPERANLKLSR